MMIQKQQINNSMNTVQPNFKGLHVIDTDVQKLLLKELSSKQLKQLSNYVKEQENNSVHILLDSKNNVQLRATLQCPYRLQNFRPEYKQFFPFESKFHFIKRIVNIANEYKKQIQNYDVNKLNWVYTILPEWSQMLKNQKSL